jgi:hypothetical protein
VVLALVFVMPQRVLLNTVSNCRLAAVATRDAVHNTTVCFKFSG